MCIRDRLDIEKYKEFIHFGLTSQDINNTAIPLSLKEMFEQVYFNALDTLLKSLERISDEWKDISMIARTHGQAASPTRMGKEINVFIERIDEQLKLLNNIPSSAKFGGATGNFNAHHVTYPNVNWHNFARDFVENNLGEYSRLRNFDFGPSKRLNTSCLSPYITHGVINEKEVISKSLEKFSFSKNEKFIQEVLWRTYWKGWLELRSGVWDDYLLDLKRIKEEFKDNKSYLNAIEGNTEIECFNEWVNELKTYNYLHNHTRMWFASIWIFTLDLPWQLGAEFFMQHLYDGDTASNTLGWRWVAGIQTQGKHYLASEWNINCLLYTSPSPRDVEEWRMPASA